MSETTKGCEDGSIRLRRISNTSMLSVNQQQTDPPLLNPEEEEADRRYIEKVIRTLQYYRKIAHARVNKTENYLNSLPKQDQEWLLKYRNHLKVLRDCIDKNQMIIKKMLRENILTSDPYVNILNHDQEQAIKIKVQDMENAQSTLKLIARDWSEEGALEREQSYKPIIDAIEEFYKPECFGINEIKILVPGAGLGRLAYELACRGFECEGNEYSYFILIASNFILNHCKEENQHTLYPWIHQYVNNLRRCDQVKSVRFPDVCTPPKGNIYMVAGDFLEVYKDPNVYDCVATCFFIDCANNIIDFIKTIFKIIIPGGIWVNLGPLLYHYSDIQGENSIEPTYEDLEIVIRNVGFEVVKMETGVRTKYSQNPRSMQKCEYESLFWICRKPNQPDNGNAKSGQNDHFSNNMDCDTGDI